jgi:transposase
MACWADLFGASFDVPLYDLTGTYFESDPPFQNGDKRRFGYSRDHRPDCVQVVIALVVTPEGFPVAYEVMPGNTADCATLRAFLDKVEGLYGKARRVWLMDRGIPTEETLGNSARAAAGTWSGRRKGGSRDWRRIWPGSRG